MCDKNRKRSASDTCLETLKRFKQSEDPVSTGQNTPALSQTIGGPIQCVVSYRDQCAHKHTNMSLY